ncbi:MAG: hypothetical protein HY22_05780 [[Candidatus Thermochlorobacteriaceae] bacterium GBChlB]|nr:MAG: hypothetical protein HY22_05780 [[Candidatus Thermochlorobacteriaceae] bacterium GBChlB]
MQCGNITLQRERACSERGCKGAEKIAGRKFERFAKLGTQKLLLFRNVPTNTELLSTMRTVTPLGELVETHELSAAEIQSRSMILPERFHKLCADLDAYRTIDLLELAALASAMGFRGSGALDASLALLEKKTLAREDARNKRIGKFVRGADDSTSADSVTDAA